MRDVDILFVLAGFPGDTDRPGSALNKMFADDNFVFLGREFPTNPEKRRTYVKLLLQAVVRYVFGTEGEAGFCRHIDQPCRAETETSRGKHKLCAKISERVACARSRPKMLVVIATDAVYESVFDAVGNACLLYKAPTRHLDVDAISEFVRGKVQEIRAFRHLISNIPHNVLAHRLPYMNYQVLTAPSVAASIQAEPGATAAVIDRHHQALYEGGVRNPRKPVRGGYILGGSVVFQRDHLHDYARLGDESRAHVFHLLKAFHAYGVPVEPGMHFDVFDRDGKAINRVFQDLLTGSMTEPAETHLNITPCDRVLG